MVFSAFFILILIALILCQISGVTNRIPLWISVLFICIALLIGKAIG